MYQRETENKSVMPDDINNTSHGSEYTENHKDHIKHSTTLVGYIE